MSDEQKTSGAGWFWFWLLVTIAFIGLCLWHSTNREFANAIPNDVRNRVAAALAGTDLATKFSIDGRDVVFSGTIAPDVPVDLLTERVRQDESTQKVLLGGLEIAGGVPATLQLESYGDTVLLTGELRDQAQVNAVVRVVEQVYGGAEIDNEIAVNPDVITQPWVTGFGEFAVSLRAASPAIFDGVGKRVLLSGRVTDPEAKTAINNAASRAFGPSVSVRNEFELVVPKVDSKLTIERQGDAVTLTGRFGDLDHIAEIVSAAESVYGAQNVSSNVSLGAAVNPATWTVASAELLLTLKLLKRMRAQFDGNALTIDGVADSVDQREAVIAALNDIGVVSIAETNIDVIAPLPPRLMVTYRDDGGIDINGVLADTESARDVVAAAASVVGALRINDQLQIDDRVARVGWAAALGDLFAAYREINGGGFDIDGTTIQLTGSVSDVSARDQVAAAAVAVSRRFDVINQILIGSQ